MNATMSVDEYRKQVRDPAIARDQDDENFRKELAKKGIGGGAGMSSKPERKHEEDDLTEEVTKYLDLLKMQHKVIEFTHTANETYTRSPKQKARLVAMGVRSGIPDMIIVTWGGVLFLELKREKGGIVSDSQKRWIEAINNAGNQGGVCAEVACGLTESLSVIDRFVSMTSGT